jgi:membrane protein implicated in regulation of membrane protease activity
MPKITGLWMGIIAIIIGILILAIPHLLQWILGIGLIVVGILAVLRR